MKHKHVKVVSGKQYYKDNRGRWRDRSNGRFVSAKVASCDK